MHNIKWQGYTPVSEEFDDIYFSQDDGMEETAHVFLEGNRLPSRWQNLENDFTIIETGFGTGLNFFASLQLWQQLPQSTNLNYISIEKHPLSGEDIEKAISLWPQFTANRNEFLLHYPECQFSLGNCHITLLLEDIATALPKITHTADAWFLDGFAPSKNPDMWTDYLYSHMSNLTDKGGTFATFTAAGAVRRGLTNQNFHVEKVKGFAKKREMLIGYKL